MLRQLAIRNVVLVESLDLEFDSGLGVLTGETGAGKSILLDALGLALGARSDAGLVRSGSDGASVSAEIELPGGHPVHDFLSEQGSGCGGAIRITDIYGEQLTIDGIALRAEAVQPTGVQFTAH